MRRYISFFIYICITPCLMMPSACDHGKPVTIGVVDVGTHLESIFDGFKAGMTDLGYIEGTDVVYRYNHDLTDSQEAIDREINRLLSDGVDILYTISNNPTMRAKIITENTAIPVVFGLVTDPVLNGFVESIDHPGGNLTGISTFSIGNSIEWMIQMAPDTKYIYMPFYRDEQDMDPFMGLLEQAAEKLGVEIYPFEIGRLEEITAAEKNFPENSAIIFAPKPWSEKAMADFLETAIKRKIPVGSFLPSLIEKTGVLTTISSDLVFIGKQAARLADQILTGTAPKDLPVESADHFFSINLKTAEAIDLQISNLVLLQANRIVR